MKQTFSVLWGLRKEYCQAGFKDGLDNPFSIPTWDRCGDEEGGDDAYYDGFIDGCMSVEGNTREACEVATDS